MAQLFAQSSDTELANLTLRDGKHRLVRAADLVSGAQLEAIAQAALERACVREAEGGPRASASRTSAPPSPTSFSAAPRALTPRNARNYLRDLPQDVDVVRVDLVERKVQSPAPLPRGGGVIMSKHSTQNADCRALPKLCGADIELGNFIAGRSRLAAPATRPREHCSLRSRACLIRQNSYLDNWWTAASTAPRARSHRSTGSLRLDRATGPSTRRT